MATDHGTPRTPWASTGDDALYAAWRDAERESEQALHAWFDGMGRASIDAYFVYRAALDREGAAARELERAAHRTPEPAAGILPLTDYAVD
jgi:hypothetical protein